MTGATHRPRSLLTLFGAVMLVGGTDMTKVAVALPEMSQAFGLSTVQTLWVGDLYALATGVALVPSAVAADRFGRKRIYLLGLAVAIAGAASAVLAPTAAALLAARAAQGAGVALVIAGTVAIIRVSFHGIRARALAYGVWTAGFSTGAALGPLIGGAAVGYGQWWWVFGINVPVLLVCLLAAAPLLRESTNPEPPSLDISSAALAAAAVGLFILGLKSLPQPDTAVWWGLAAMTAGAVAASLFVLRQLRMTRPFLDVRLLANPLLARSALVIAVTLGAFNGVLTLRYQYLDGLTAFDTGIALLPLALAMALGGIASPALQGLFAPQHILIAAMGTLTFGFMLLANMPGNGMLVGVVLLGAGSGAVMTIGANTLMSSAPQNRTADAGAIQESAFALGSGSGIAVLGVMAIYYATPAATAPSPSEVYGAGADTALSIAALLYACFTVAASLLLLATTPSPHKTPRRARPRE